MKKSWKVVFVAVPIWALVSAFASAPVFAQSRQEPRLEGVGYSELAEWQGRYGGGIPFGVPCGPGYGYPVYMPDYCIQEPAVTYKKKRAVRKGRK